MSAQDLTATNPEERSRLSGRRSRSGTRAVLSSRTATSAVYLGVLVDAAEADAFEREGAGGPVRLQAVHEKRRGGGTTGDEVERRHAACLGLERRPRLDEVVDKDVRAELVEERAEAWRGEVAGALEDRHEAGGEALGGVQRRRKVREHRQVELDEPDPVRLVVCKGSEVGRRGDKVDDDVEVVVVGGAGDEALGQLEVRVDVAVRQPREHDHAHALALRLRHGDR